MCTEIKLTGMRFSVILSLVMILFLSKSIYAQKENKVRNKKVKTEIVQDTLKIVTEDTITDDFNVSIKFMHYYPYCGGAYPDESELNNYFIFTNTTYNLINLTDKTKIQVKTDSLGYLNIFLPPGKYGIQELFKDCTFDEFYERYKSKTTDQYTEDQGTICYRSWWSSMLVEFEITDSTTVFTWEATTFSACFTGENPCLNYFGPYPP
ncbi:MAG: hypothetical protein IPM74_07105 [Crocinitomicaceae bacterium]|nr:hypothetical protein [Crocinitomicaceae bacterium]MBK8925667.1 hypothetical protein [Crocinitomicaceae bacterium]